MSDVKTIQKQGISTATANLAPQRSSYGRHSPCAEYH